MINVKSLFPIETEFPVRVFHLTSIESEPFRVAIVSNVIVDATLLDRTVFKVPEIRVPFLYNEKELSESTLLSTPIPEDTNWPSTAIQFTS